MWIKCRGKKLIPQPTKADIKALVAACDLAETLSRFDCDCQEAAGKVFESMKEMLSQMPDDKKDEKADE